MKRYKISIVLASMLFKQIAFAQQIENNNHQNAVQYNVTETLIDRDINQPIVDAKERYIRFSTNDIVDFDKKFSRTFKYNASLNYGMQSGYQQTYYDADVTAESYATISGTKDVNYLPSSYLSRMWVNGNVVMMRF